MTNCRETASARPVIILGRGVGAIGVIHALHAVGVPVIQLYPEQTRNQRSRLVASSMAAPCARTNGKKLLELLLNPPDPWRGALLLPVSDADLELVSRHHDDLSAIYALAPPPWQITGQLLDKTSLYRQARQLDIQLPKMILPHEAEDLLRQLAGFPFPCLIKPDRHPFYWEKFDRKVSVFEDAPSLLEHYDDLLRLGIRPIISEIIPGPDSHLFEYDAFLDRDGRLVAEMLRRKRRVHPPRYGIACVIETVPVEPLIREQSLRLLRHCNHYGYSHTEFKLDARDGRFVLIEVNPRPPTSQSLATSAGINFPELSWRMANGEIGNGRTEYRSGLCWINQFFECWTLARAMKKRDLTLGEFLAPYRQPHIYALPFGKDPEASLATAIEVFGSSALNRIRGWQRRLNPFSGQ